MSLLFVHKVTLVEHDHIGELDLLHHELGDGADGVTVLVGLHAAQVAVELRARGLYQHVVELPLLGQGDDLVHQVGLEGAAETAVLHGNNLIALYEGGLVDETLVDVEGGHVVHDDGALKVLVLVLGLEDVLHHGGLARTQEPAQQRHGQQVILGFAGGRCQRLEI